MVDHSSINLPFGGISMAHYVGIDASLETVNDCVVDDDGTICLERKIVAEPEAILELLREFSVSQLPGSVSKPGLRRPDCILSCVQQNYPRFAWNVVMLRSGWGPCATRQIATMHAILRNLSGSVGSDGSLSKATKRNGPGCFWSVAAIYWESRKILKTVSVAR